jgi:hypothetical protein
MLYARRRPARVARAIHYPARVRPLVTLVLLVACAAPVTAQSTRQVVARGSAYVAAYEAELPSLVADERYEQRATEAGSGRTDEDARVLESELGWVRLARVGETVAVREVTFIDGQPAAGDARLRNLLERPPADPDAEIRAILAESARHNLGPDGRNFNFPTFVLVYLRADRAGQLSWRSTRRDGRAELRFTEPPRGTVVRSAAGAPVQARGRFVVDLATGRVERAEVHLREVTRVPGQRGVVCDLVVTFAEHPQLGLWLPNRMDEHYEREQGQPHGSVRIEGRATYANYRRYVATGRLIP